MVETNLKGFGMTVGASLWRVEDRLSSMPVEDQLSLGSSYWVLVVVDKGIYFEMEVYHRVRLMVVMNLFQMLQFGVVGDNSRFAAVRREPA